RRPGRLTSGTVGDQLHRHHGAEPADITHLWVTIMPTAHSGERAIAEPRATLRKVLLEKHVDDGQRGGAGHRVAAKRSAQPTGIGGVHQLAAPDDRTERQATA